MHWDVGGQPAGTGLVWFWGKNILKDMAEGRLPAHPEKEPSWAYQLCCSFQEIIWILFSTEKVYVVNLLTLNIVT